MRQKKILYLRSEIWQVFARSLNVKEVEWKKQKH
jgi:hypothetical protein